MGELVKYLLEIAAAEGERFHVGQGDSLCMVNELCTLEDHVFTPDLAGS